MSIALGYAQGNQEYILLEHQGCEVNFGLG